MTAPKGKAATAPVAATTPAPEPQTGGIVDDAAEEAAAAEAAAVAARELSEKLARAVCVSQGLDPDKFFMGQLTWALPQIMQQVEAFVVMFNIMVDAAMGGDDE